MLRRCNVYTESRLDALGADETLALRDEARARLRQQLRDSGMPVDDTQITTGIESAGDVMRGTRAWAQVEV